MGCHGSKGDGTLDLSAPALNILPPWYVSAQLRAFRDGHRGAHPQDSFGRQMRSIVSEGLVQDGDIEAVAAYIGIPDSRK